MARNLPEWMSMISKAYTSASDESADMKLAAESLEAIKTSIHVDNIFEILSTLDRQIARVNGTELQSVILKLGKIFLLQFYVGFLMNCMKILK